MKRTSNYLKCVLIVFVISASAISCSNDEFFGFEDIDAQFDLYSEMVSDNTNKYTAQNRSALGTATIYVNASYQVIGLRDKYNFEAGDRNFVNEELTQFLGLLGTGYFPVYYGTHIDY